MSTPRASFPNPTALVEARRCLCPVPVTRTARRIARLRAGDVLEIVADDRMLLVDLPSWCQASGHDYLGHEVRGRALHFYVRKGPQPSSAPAKAARAEEANDPPRARKGERRARARAVGLVSGGLDSTLAAKMLKRQGVDIVGLHFSTGFCKVDHRRAVGRAKDRERSLESGALRVGAEGEFPVEIIDVAEEYLQEVVLRPKH